MKRPDRLKQGDTVAVAAPAGVVDPDVLEKGLNSLKRMGLRPVVADHVCSRDRYMAGTDEQRAGDLRALFEDPEIKAIFCARGGYGANRILPHLDPAIIRKNPKIFVGSSDITLLLLFLVQQCSLVAFHGPMVAGNFGRYPMSKSKRQFKEILSGDRKGKRLTAKSARIFRPGTAEGKVTGGCLTLLCRSLGTPWEIKTRNRILLIEDVNEPLYRIDGMLWQLKQAGKFKGIRGIVFGEMVNCLPSDHAGGSFKDILRDVFADSSFPILTDFPSGHGREMFTLPLGLAARLDAGTKTLDFENCGVL
ncbi:MAG: LD-carboxypeptidase [Nitrospinae bacterium]|nr:LD-carboxypeptidase [Nitrospinota bacterium]